MSSFINERLQSEVRDFYLRAVQLSGDSHQIKRVHSLFHPTSIKRQHSGVTRGRGGRPFPPRVPAASASSPPSLFLAAAAVAASSSVESISTLASQVHLHFSIHLYSLPGNSQGQRQFKRLEYKGRRIISCHSVLVLDWWPQRPGGAGALTLLRWTQSGDSHVW